jgi:hypothetical protein
VSLPARQHRLLLVLAALLVLLAGRWLWPRLAPDDAGALAARQLRAAGGSAVREVEDLHLADLEARPAVYESGRNPFSYGEPPRPPGPTPEQLAEMARQRAADELLRRQLAQQASPPPPPVPQPPDFVLRYLGSFGSERLRIAVFTDGENIYNAMVGDVLEDKFIIDYIGFESVDVRFVGFPDAPARRLSVGG